LRGPSGPPLVGISTSEVRFPRDVDHTEHAESPRRALAVGATYAEALAQAGGVPVVLAPVAVELIDPLLALLDPGPRRERKLGGRFLSVSFLSIRAARTEDGGENGEGGVRHPRRILTRAPPRGARSGTKRDRESVGSVAARGRCSVGVGSARRRQCPRAGAPRDRRTLHWPSLNPPGGAGGSKSRSGPMKKSAGLFPTRATPMAGWILTLVMATAHLRLARHRPRGGTLGLLALLGRPYAPPPAPR
jgi:hypothetical protein